MIERIAVLGVPLVPDRLIAGVALGGRLER